MKKPLRISIPDPCHQEWEKMTPVAKGRFCDSCQKKVIDFSRSSDREIVRAFAKDENLCGRFLDTQLDRDLIVTTEKNSWWIAASAAVLSLMTGTIEAVAQTNVVAEQTEAINPENPTQILSIRGNVSDEAGALPGTTISVKDSTISTQTDMDGNFTIEAMAGNILEFSYPGFTTQHITISGDKPLNIMLVVPQAPSVTMERYRSTAPRYVAGGKGTVISREMIKSRTEKKRTFFGRIFHSIENLFRKNE